MEDAEHLTFFLFYANMEINLEEKTHFNRIYGIPAFVFLINQFVLWRLYRGIKFFFFFS